MTTIEISGVLLSFTERGAGRPVLLLHGGGGPLTVAGFADLLAAERPARVITPVHPGFGGTPRPDGLATIGGLAALYVALLDELGLDDVTVVGNSIGGWIAAEMALLGSGRVRDIVLVDAVGIEVPEHPVVDFFGLSFPEIAQLSYFAPEKFRIDPAAMTPEQQAVLAGNRAALGTYAAAMTDPTLRDRLAAVTTPTRVIWGDHDRIVTPEYGRALAAAIPGAEFVLMTETGHLPQLESPKRLLALLD
ncbi:alpha/beta fold hydrolase [Actinoplanes awajinensis]|uniref:Alpha/beta hydrolase n=1 Tax=Actinoplanes awajinensis subsp. mycoplanecinus TaxID=135947 RepID=A0A101JB91_9ACTN|nr:alpha/beta fold hydrolase [Actinoplanes awajinensis]KUL23580.1 alpha/beta hydrolase [Actinoplanes awajinensis subsp. mycoplanecinus]